MALKKAIIPVMEKDVVDALNNEVEVNEAGFEIKAPVLFDENINVEGNINGIEWYAGAAVTSTNKYQLRKIEFVAGTSDSTNKLKCTLGKYQAGTPGKYTVTAYNVVSDNETVLLSGVTSISNWDVAFWESYSGSIAINNGEVIVSDKANHKLIAKIGGVTRELNPPASAVAFDTNDCTLVTADPGIVYTDPIPESITTITRNISM